MCLAIGQDLSGLPHWNCSLMLQFGKHAHGWIQHDGLVSWVSKREGGGWMIALREWHQVCHVCIYDCRWQRNRTFHNILILCISPTNPKENTQYVCLRIWWKINAGWKGSVSTFLAPWSLQPAYFYIFFSTNIPSGYWLWQKLIKQRG